MYSNLDFSFQTNKNVLITINNANVLGTDLALPKILPAPLFLPEQCKTSNGSFTLQKSHLFFQDMMSSHLSIKKPQDFALFQSQAMMFCFQQINS